MISLPQLEPSEPELFPEPARALHDPNGLLAFGGDLSVERLLAAYRRGIFPWFSEGEPILWWSPDPRCVFRTEDLHPNRSLRRQVARHDWRITVDRAFDEVIRACAEPRGNDLATWIVPAMVQAYIALHRAGHAHSVEVWDGEDLVGGIYGLAIGHLFCGESMFSRQSGASKAALMALATLLRNLGYPLIDSQVANAHTLSLGAKEIPRANYLEQISVLVEQMQKPGNWSVYGAELSGF